MVDAYGSIVESVRGIVSLVQVEALLYLREESLASAR